MAGKKDKQYGKLRPSEIVLSIIAVLMLLGWAFRAMGYGGPPEPPPDTVPDVFPWFASFSIPSAVLVLVLIFLKLNCINVLPGEAQEKILPYISLLPILGFLIAELSSVQTFLTVGGAVALAYISATSYWRNYIPDFITNPLGAEDEDTPEPRKTPSPSAPATSPSSAPPTAAPSSPPASETGDDAAPESKPSKTETSEASSADSADRTSSPDEPRADRQSADSKPGSKPDDGSSGS